MRRIQEKEDWRQLGNWVIVLRTKCTDGPCSCQYVRCLFFEISMETHREWCVGGRIITTIFEMR